MYFKVFTLGTNTEKSIEKAGFLINSFEEVKTYQGEAEETISYKPKDYYFDGSVWEKFDISDFSERIILLCRLPSMPFQELWNLYFYGEKEDRFGALNILAKRHVKQVIDKINSLTKEQINLKIIRKRLLELKKNPIVANCSFGKQMVSAIDNLNFL